MLAHRQLIPGHPTRLLEGQPADTTRDLFSHKKSTRLPEQNVAVPA